MRIWLAAALVTGIAVPVGTGYAQNLGHAVNCGEREALVQRLERMFGEVQRGAGLVSAAQLIEVWGSEETGTWTIIMTNADGQSCVVAAGEAWRDIELVAREDPA